MLLTPGIRDLPPPFLSVRTLETCGRKQAREALVSNMDPELRAYLEHVNNDAVAHSDAILKVLAVQTSRIDDLATWKSDLEACFVALESKVSALQLVRPAAAASTGEPVATDPSVSPPTTKPGEAHGKFGHGNEHFPVGSPSASLPACPLVTGMITSPFPRFIPSTDSTFTPHTLASIHLHLLVNPHLL